MTLERLKEYGAIKREVADLEEKIEQLQLRAEGIGAVVTDKPAVKGSSVNAAEEARTALVDMKDLYAKKVQLMTREMKKIETAISKLPGIDRTIMRRRYIDGEMVADIAVSVGYSERQVIRRMKVSLVKLKRA